MATFETFFKAIVKDIAVELSDEFDQNFERKAFFNEKWAETKWANPKGSLMNRSGGLRRSFKKQVNGDSITWSSSRKDATLHNDGGEITVTVKMKRFFWAMYYKANGAITQRKDGTAGNTKRNQKLAGEAAIWKSMALMKTGSKIKIPQRRVIGPHPEVSRIINEISDEHFKELGDFMNQLLNPKGLGVRNIKFK